MLLRLDQDEDQPLYLRIGWAVRRGIAHGEIAPGDRLPAARALAEELDVNMHTVLRAYADLRDEGIIELRRGRGAVVVDAADSVTQHAKTALHGQIADLVAAGRRSGLGREHVIAMIEDQW